MNQSDKDKALIEAAEKAYPDRDKYDVISQHCRRAFLAGAAFERESVRGFTSSALELVSLIDEEGPDMLKWRRVTDLCELLKRFGEVSE